MVDLSDPHWLHGEFNTLVGLFDRVGLQTNVGKTVSMGISLRRRTGDGYRGRA